MNLQSSGRGYSFDLFQPLAQAASDGLRWFLYGRVSPGTITRELILVGLAFSGFLYLERNLLDGTLTYVNDSILWYGMYHYFAESLWNGFWPLWNPYVHGGEPFYYAWNIIRLLDPVTLLTLGAAKVVAPPLFDLYHYNYLLRILITMAGIYAVYRQLLTHFLSAYVAFIVSLLGFLAIGALSVVAYLDAFCWFPWILFCMLRMLDPGKAKRNIEAVCLSYLLGIMVGASIYHWAFPAFVLTLFGATLFINRREDLRRFISIDRTVLVASLALFLVLAAPLIALAPERPKIVPVVRLYDRDRETPWLTRILGVDYSDIEHRSPQIGLGNFSSLKGAQIWVRNYEPPETSFVAKLLLVIGLLFGRHRYKLHFLGVGAVTAFLFIGPYWPFGFLHKLLYFSFPPLWLARHLSIFSPFVYFFIVFFVGLGCDRVLAWLSGQSPLGGRPLPNLPARLGLPGVMRFYQTLPLSVQESVSTIISLVVGAIFLVTLPLSANFFNHLHDGHQVEHIFLPTIFVWLIAILLFYPLLRRIRHSIPLLLFLSILVLEQWTISVYFHGTGLFQNRATYFQDFAFPKTAADTFSLPPPRIAGLDFKKSYLSYGPTLMKANVALEDFLPPRRHAPCGGSNLSPGFFGMNFPMGLYHFWPKPYLKLYEIGEVQPGAFQELIGIGKPVVDFYSNVVLMDENGQDAFFRQAPLDRIKNVLRHAVFLEEPLPESLRHLHIPPLSPALEMAVTTFRPVWNESFETWNESNESFETWEPTGLPDQWSYTQGGTGGWIEPASDKENVKEGRLSAALYPSSHDPSFIRYAFPDVAAYRGQSLIAEAWVKSQSFVCNSITMDIQTGAKENLVSVKSYTKRGEWEKVRIEKRVEHDAAYLLITLNVTSASNQPAYFDAVRVLVGNLSSSDDTGTRPRPHLEKVSTDQTSKVGQDAFSYRVLSYIPTRLELETVTKRDGVLLYRENDQTDWAAYIDGERVKLYRANLAFKALPLKKGTHRIVLEYRPIIFLSALYAYLAGNVAFVAWGITTWVRRRRSES